MSNFLLGLFYLRDIVYYFSTSAVQIAVEEISKVGPPPFRLTSFVSQRSMDQHPPDSHLHQRAPLRRHRVLVVQPAKCKDEFKLYQAFPWPRRVSGRMGHT